MIKRSVSKLKGGELEARLGAFCRSRPIQKLEIFGSVAKGTANERSDLDLLATFTGEAPKGFAYFSFVQEMENELADLLGCKVDLLDREPVEHARNPILRREILGRAKMIYERPA